MRIADIPLKIRWNHRRITNEQSSNNLSWAIERHNAVGSWMVQPRKLNTNRYPKNLIQEMTDVVRFQTFCSCRYAGLMAARTTVMNCESFQTSVGLALQIFSATVPAYGTTWPATADLVAIDSSFAAYVIIRETIVVAITVQMSWLRKTRREIITPVGRTIRSRLYVSSSRNYVITRHQLQDRWCAEGGRSSVTMPTDVVNSRLRQCVPSTRVGPFSNTDISLPVS